MRNKTTPQTNGYQTLGNCYLAILVAILVAILHYDIPVDPNALLNIAWITLTVILYKLRNPRRVLSNPTMVLFSIPCVMSIYQLVTYLQQY